MPIHSFELRDFNSIKFAKINKLNSLSIICGPNGVGKSTLLHALWSIEHQNEFKKIASTSDIKILYFSPSRVPAPFSVNESNISTESYSNYIESIASRSERFDSTSNLPDILKIKQYLHRHPIKLDILPYYYLKISIINLKQIYLKILEKYYQNIIKTGIIEKVPDIYQPLRELVNLLPDIKFDYIKFEKSQFKICFKNSIRKDLDFDDLSSGQQDFISLLFPITEMKIHLLFQKFYNYLKYDDITILIDSPELHLHSSLLLIFMDYIRKSIKWSQENNIKIQFIISTHSPVLINACMEDELYIFSYKHESKPNQIIRVDELKNIREVYSIFKELGLSNLSSGKPVVLVEGEYDVRILVTFFSFLNFKSLLIPLSGKGKINRTLDGLQKAIEEIKIHFGVHVFALLDKDRAINIVHLPNLKLLPVNCIENYLLDSEAIYNTIKDLGKQKILIAKKIASPSDFKIYMDNLIQSPETFNHEMEKRLNENFNINFFPNTANHISTIESLTTYLDNYYNNKYLTKIINIYKKTRENVESIINSTNYKEVDGKHIISLIAKDFHISVNKLKIEIAEKIYVLNKTPVELKEILTAMIPN